MLFKQEVLKERKSGSVFVCILSSFFPILVMTTKSFWDINDWKMQILVLVLFCLPLISIVVSLCTDMEWYCVHKDRIEARCVFGIRNIVYYDKVLFVEERKISVSKGCYKQFYIFNDGRKNNRTNSDYNDHFNRKKYNLRIYKTERLEDFITNELKLEIIVKQSISEFYDSLKK